AETGIYVDWDYVIPLTRHSAALVSASVARNSVDPNVLGAISAYNPAISPWWSLGVFAGFQFSAKIGMNTGIYALAQGGIVHGISPSASVTVDTITFHQDAVGGTDFAYRLGAGINLGERFTVEAQYMAASPTFDITTTGGGYSANNSIAQPMDVITVSFGIQF
ncbi:MAG TPA: hypothetical protein VKS81_03895, partial [Bacteroidota bacterium]|nr:hypothetical protein [Bacteroidota bacterium]